MAKVTKGEFLERMKTLSENDTITKDDVITILEDVTDSWDEREINLDDYVEKSVYEKDMGDMKKRYIDRFGSYEKKEDAEKKVAVDEEKEVKIYED